MRTETHVNNELAEVGGFSEGDRQGFGKEILGRWIGGEDMQTFPEDTFYTMKTRIVGGGERQVMVWGGGGQLGRWRPRNSCFWIRGTG